MSSQRVTAVIDGFNLYHALVDLGANHLKWLDLRAICQTFAPSPDFTITEILYFSAYATWRTASYSRHRRYIAALEATGVTPVMGKFKEKERRCRKCGSVWRDHEEKETDVNIALYLYRGAINDQYDRALLISGDSDLGPAVRFVKHEFPQKIIRVIAPPGRRHSMELVQAAGGRSNAKSMQPIHLSRCLLPQEVKDDAGNVAATRPSEYDPPI